MKYIVLDLEWNQSAYGRAGEHPRLPFEIIEIGAVKLDHKYRLESEFRELITPKIYRKLHHTIRNMLNYDEKDLQREGKPFKDVCKRFLDWCGEDAAFITWSDNDIFMLEDNMSIHEMDIDDLPECYDVQLLFDDQITQEDRNFALSYAMWKFEIKPERSHDALNDAINTVAVMRKLDFSEGLEGYGI